MAVLWPFGTTFDPAVGELVIPTGTRLGSGDSFEGSGGFLGDGTDILELADLASRNASAEACVRKDAFYAVGSFGDEPSVSVPPQSLPPGVTSTTPT